MRIEAWDTAIDLNRIAGEYQVAPPVAIPNHSSYLLDSFHRAIRCIPAGARRLRLTVERWNSSLNLK
jgi:hypothetical protein